MGIVPPSVSHYLQDYAPKEGHLLGYWLDKKREYNVLVLHRRNDEFRFSLGFFPEVVGHWGHQLSGMDYSVEEMWKVLEFDWDADEQTKEKIRTLVDRIERGWEIDDILSTCRKLEPFRPIIPPRGPRLTDEGQYKTIKALADSLSDQNTEVASAAADKLAYFGLTEDDGPLFVRNALLRYRKRKARSEAPKQPAPVTPPQPPAEIKKESAQPIPAHPGITKRRTKPVPLQQTRRVPAYLLMVVGCPLLVFLLGLIYGSSLTTGKGDYIWAFFIACGIWGFFAGVVKLCRFKRPIVVFAFALLTAIGVLSWGHYIDYDWEAKDSVYQRIHNDVVPRGRWVPGTRKYELFKPEELEQYPSDWKKLDRDQLYVRYLRKALHDDRAGGFLDHLRVRAKEGFVTPPHGKWPASYRGGFWVWWAWGVHAVLLVIGALFSAAASLMEREKDRT